MDISESSKYASSREDFCEAAGWGGKNRRTLGVVFYLTASAVTSFSWLSGNRGLLIGKREADSRCKEKEV